MDYFKNHKDIDKEGMRKGYIDNVNVLSIHKYLRKCDNDCSVSTCSNIYFAALICILIAVPISLYFGYNYGLLYSIVYPMLAIIYTGYIYTIYKTKQNASNMLQNMESSVILRKYIVKKINICCFNYINLVTLGIFFIIYCVFIAIYANLIFSYCTAIYVITTTGHVMFVIISAVYEKKYRAQFVLVATQLIED